jgi:hypothetical protein
MYVSTYLLGNTFMLLTEDKGGRGKNQGLADISQVEKFPKIYIKT